MNAPARPLRRSGPLRSLGSIRKLPALIALFALAPALAAACLWDHDTLRQERSQFPEALELITGKFLRHSPEFYEWRIKDRLEKLKADPQNLGYHDDLAVAYSKVGRTKDAVATMEAAHKLQPGRYETYSNLGTFYILAGEFEKGLPYIDKALAINPDAHFGREKYQKWLVEYTLTKRDASGKLSFPLHRMTVENTDNFRRYLNIELHQQKSGTPTDEEISAAILGVLGMMRFANHDNPLLLEALGDLLAHPYGSENDGQRLAARAYLQASYGMKDAESREEYRKLADRALYSQQGSRKPSEPWPNLEDDFKQEFADAKTWYDELRAKELAWIRDGKNVDEEFDRLYAADPPNVRDFQLDGDLAREAKYRRRFFWTQTVGLLVGSCAIVAAIMAYRRSRKPAISQ